MTWEDLPGIAGSEGQKWEHSSFCCCSDEGCVQGETLPGNSGVQRGSLVFTYTFQKCTDGPGLLIQLLAKDPASLLLSWPQSTAAHESIVWLGQLEKPRGLQFPWPLASRQPSVL